MKINKNVKLIVGSSMIIITIAGFNFVKHNNETRKYKFYEISNYEVLPNTNLNLILDIIEKETCFDENSKNLFEEMEILEQLVLIDNELYILTKDTDIIKNMPTLEEAEQMIIENTNIEIIDSASIISYYSEIKDNLDLFNQLNDGDRRNRREMINFNNQILPIIKAYIVLLRNDICTNYANEFSSYINILEQSMIMDKYGIDVKTFENIVNNNELNQMIDDFADYEYFIYYTNDFDSYLDKYNSSNEKINLEERLVRKLATTLEVTKEVLGRNYNEHLGFRHEYKDSIYNSYNLGNKKLQLK